MGEVSTTVGVCVSVTMCRVVAFVTTIVVAVAPPDVETTVVLTAVAFGLPGGAGSNLSVTVVTFEV